MGCPFGTLRSIFCIWTFSNSLSRFSIYFLWKYNRYSVYFKEMPPSKILPGRCVKPGASFHTSRFFFNIPEIFVQIHKTTKY